MNTPFWGPRLIKTWISLPKRPLNCLINVRTQKPSINTKSAVKCQRGKFTLMLVLNHFNKDGIYSNSEPTILVIIIFFRYEKIAY